jgi:hypothetical protein
MGRIIRERFGAGCRGRGEGVREKEQVEGFEGDR